VLNFEIILLVFSRSIFSPRAVPSLDARFIPPLFYLLKVESAEISAEEFFPPKTGV
jgi:hypothetical protein